MLIVEFDGPPSSFLGASETGESTKCRGGGHGGRKSRLLFFLPLHPHAVNPTTTTYGHFVLSPVSPATRDEDGRPSNSTIGICTAPEMIPTLK